MGFQATGGHKIQSDRCCILFHPKSGMIQHVHRVITYVGAEETPATDIERTARRMMQKPGSEAQSLQSLMVNSRELAGPGRYQVDPKARRILKLALDSRAVRKPAAKRKMPAKRKTSKASAKRPR
jgi:hypothetical protein